MPFPPRPAPSGPPTPEQILAENRRVHAEESAIYDRVHGEIFNSYEQRLLAQDLDLLPSPRGTLALDLGAGTGNLSLKLARRGHAVTAVDLSPQMLRALASRAQAEGLHITTLCQDVDTFLDGRGDQRLPPVVTMSSFLHHLPHPWETLRRIADLVPPGGLLYITHEPTGARSPALVRTLGLADRALWNLRHPRLTSRARAIDYTVSDHHAREGLPAVRLGQTLESAGLHLELVRHYTAARSSLLSRLATRLGGADQVTLLARRPFP